MSEEQAPQLDPSAPPAEKHKRIRPTLYIGLGGTGKEIMLRLRRRILQTLWNGKRIESMDDFPVASFLYFDTYTGKAEDEEKKGGKGAEDDPLLPLVKLPSSDSVQKALDVDKYLRGEELERYPLVKGWLPQGELRAINAEQGAGQVRAISRLLFFDEARTLNQVINNKARALLQNVGNERLRALGLEIEPEVKIVILCSVAGGTGSGAFLDMGYLCRSLQNPKPAEVNLYAITGGAFAGGNERVLANSYAAMSELEYCMRDNDKDSYVTSWAEGLSNQATRPFNDVYLIDNANMARQSTGERSHLFGMVADVLFEELHDPVFRGKRAEDLVNQAQHKLQPFVPPQMPAELGTHAQRFSRSYSSIGQVTLYTQGRIEFERETAEAARDMIKAFFRLSEEDNINVPTPQDVDDFLRDHMRLDKKGYFSDFPDFLRHAKDRTLPDYPLVDEMLKQGESRLDQVLGDHVRSDFAALRDSGRDPSEWRGEAESIRKQRDKDIEGAVDSASREATYPRAVKEQRRRLMNVWAGPHGLREALYKRLDNKEKGGLNYTIQLIREIRDALTSTSTGVCSRLEKTADELEADAAMLRKEHYTRALDNLEKAASKGLLRGPNLEKCEEFLKQAEDATRYYLYYRLRALACREASEMLRHDVIAELGQPSVMGEESTSAATGIIAEFEQGRAAVRVALEELEAEIRVLDDTANAETPLRASIPGGGIDDEFDQISRSQLADWGEDALADYGGSNELFQQLRNDKTRPHILSALRGKARENMQEREKLLPTVQEALAAMPAAERQKLFQEAFSYATPWINADLEKDNGWDPKMVTTFVAVENVHDFMKAFADEIRPRLPVGLTKELYSVSSSERGRLVIYAEYSGMPLNVMIALHDDWRLAYHRFTTGDRRLPLHNHKMTERFQRPTAMSVEELRALHDQLKLFLKGVGLGVLRRRPEPDGRYELNVSRIHVPDWQAIGREQQLYLTGFPDGKEPLVRQQVERVEQRMSLLQTLLGAALFSYIAEQSYSRTKISLQRGEEARIGGIAHHAAKAVSDAYRQRFDGASGRRDIPAETNTLLAALESRVAEWVQEIPDSTLDTTSLEANLNPDSGDEERRAKNKVWVDFARISDDQIRRWAGLSVEAESATAQATAQPEAGPQQGAVGSDTAGPPPLPAGPEFFLGINNQQQGPFTFDQLKQKRLSGELNEETLVWRKGLSNWARCGELDELDSLFVGDAPPPLPTT